MMDGYRDGSSTAEGAAVVAAQSSDRDAQAQVIRWPRSGAPIVVHDVARWL